MSTRLSHFQRDRTNCQPDLEIVICTHNRSKLLARTLRFLNEAARPPGWQVQVLVVANACKDETLATLRSYALEATARRLPLRWFDEPKSGKANALNRAIPLLSAPMIAFIDDDHRVERNYFLGIQAAELAYPDAILFCGRLLPDWDGSEPFWVHDNGPYRIRPLPIPYFDKGDEPHEILDARAIPPGGNLFLRKKALKVIGDFMPTLGPIGHDLGGGEDREWIMRALSLGARLQYVPDVVQYHYVDPARLTTSYLIRKAYKRSAAAVRLSDEARETSRIPKYLVRKIATYLLRSLISFSEPTKRRFHLVRLAASLGEAKGFIDAKNDRRHTVSFSAFSSQDVNDAKITKPL